MEIRNGVELPKKQASGRPRGSGINLRLLRSLKPGDVVWDVPTKRMDSIKNSARLVGIKLIIRRIPKTNLFAFRIRDTIPKNESQDNQA